MKKSSTLLLETYQFLCKGSKRELTDQLKVARLMIRGCLFLVVGALCYSAVYSLSLAEIITVGIPIIFIMFVFQLIFFVERNTKPTWEKMVELEKQDKTLKN